MTAFKFISSQCLLFSSFMRESLSYRNKSTDLQYRPMNWFLYDRDLPHEILNHFQVNYLLEDITLYDLGGSIHQKKFVF